MDALPPPPPAIVREAPGAGGYTLNSPAGTWAPTALPVQWRVSSTPSRDVGTDAEAELDVALRAWEQVACSGFRASVAASTSAPPADDGVNVVYFHDDAWPSDLPPNVVATTVVHVDGAGNLHDADVHLNGAQYTFSLDGRSGTVDLRSVLTHEMGHALGLGHSAVAGATMTPSVPEGVAWRSLESDDRDGVCALYPGVGLVAGCDARGCPAGLLCVAKVCERPGARATVCSPCDRVPGACAGAGDDARCVDRALGGRVCGRACAGDADCGAGFRCQATTSAGDLQCVSIDGCTHAENPCEKDADCTQGVCLGGACVGADPATDAGVDGARPGAGTTSNAASGGCVAAPSTDDAAGAWLVAFGAVATVARRRQRSRG